jgi:hypothetical protein
VKVFIVVGKNLISLLACSILAVYKGVVTDRGLAAANAAAHDTVAMLITAINIFRFAFIFSPPFLEELKGKIINFLVTSLMGQVPYFGESLP